RKVHRALVDIDQHDHGEHILHDVLRNIHDVDPMLIERLRDLGDDAGAVLADHRDNCAHTFSSDFIYIFLNHKNQPVIYWNTSGAGDSICSCPASTMVLMILLD